MSERLYRPPNSILSSQNASLEGLMNVGRRRVFAQQEDSNHSEVKEVVENKGRIHSSASKTKSEHSHHRSSGGRCKCHTGLKCRKHPFGPPATSANISLLKRFTPSFGPSVRLPTLSDLRKKV